MFILVLMGGLFWIFLGRVVEWLFLGVFWKEIIEKVWNLEGLILDKLLFLGCRVR
jgi:hypothetical protein